MFAALSSASRSLVVEDREDLVVFERLLALETLRCLGTEKRAIFASTVALNSSIGRIRASNHSWLSELHATFKFSIFSKSWL